jgi:Helix-turn-helix domain
MARTLDDFIAGLPEDEQHAIHQEAERLIAEELTLGALRKARACSQDKLGQALHIKQAAVSRLERRTDMYLSTLRAYIEAMGGELDIIARFPDQAPVRISQFAGLGEEVAH